MSWNIISIMLLGGIENQSWVFPELGVKKDRIVLSIFYKDKILILKDKKISRSIDEDGILSFDRNDYKESNMDALLRGMEEKLGINKNDLKKFIGKNSFVDVGKYHLGADKVISHAFTVNCTDPLGLEKSIKENGNGEVEFVEWRKIINR